MIDESTAIPVDPGTQAPVSSEPVVGHVSCEEKIQQYEQGWKRALADYQNLQKETESQKRALVQWCEAELLGELIPMADHFDDALKNLPEGSNSWAEGVRYIHKELEELLTRHGVIIYGAVGDRFDPTLHESVEHEEGLPDKEHTIARVTARGFKLNDRVLRAARVVVYTTSTINQ